MGQARNSNRNASLNDAKERAAGRLGNPVNPVDRDFDAPTPGRGRTKGAFGGGAGKPSKTGGGARGKGGK